MQSLELLSVEILIREMWLAYRYNKKQLDQYINLEHCFLDYMKSGQPFEIVDGDNNESLLKYIYPLISSN